MRRYCSFMAAGSDFEFKEEIQSEYCVVYIK